jgi:ADP-ribose pyrophosphatase
MPHHPTIPPHARKVFSGIIFDTYHYDITDYNGNTQTFEKLGRNDSTLVLATTADERILINLEEQPGKPQFWTLPGGRVETDEDPLEAAKRELLEETGYTSDNWALLSEVQPFSKIAWTIHTYVVKQAIKTTEPQLDGGEKIDTRLVTLEEFCNLVREPSFNSYDIKIMVYEALLNPTKMAELKQLLF